MGNFRQLLHTFSFEQSKWSQDVRDQPKDVFHANDEPQPSDEFLESVEHPRNAGLSGRNVLSREGRHASQ